MHCWMQDKIEVAKKQQQRAKHIWQQYRRDLAEAEHQRQRIFSSFEDLGDPIPAKCHQRQRNVL